MIMEDLDGPRQASESVPTPETHPFTSETNTWTNVTNAPVPPELTRRPRDDIQDRPPTAAPSLISQHSVDSAIGEEGQVLNSRQMDPTNVQDVVEVVDPGNVGSLGLNESQQQDLQAAVDGGQLAEEQELDPDVRRVFKPHRRRKTSASLLSNPYVFLTGRR